MSAKRRAKLKARREAKAAEDALFAKAFAELAKTTMVVGAGSISPLNTPDGKWWLIKGTWTNGTGKTK